MTVFVPLPVTIVSGFPGAGKTTLLRHLIGASTGRVAILKNELGSVSIDDELLASARARRIEVVFGRSCREAGEDLARQLYAIAAEAGDFDHLFIEMSGVAHPGVLAALLLVDSALRHRLRLDGIVTVVDVVNYSAHAGGEDYADKQVAYADAVVLSKSELVSVTAVDQLLQRLRRINPRTRYFVTTDARVPAHELLQLGGFDFSRIEADVVDLLGQEYGGKSEAREIETVAVTCRHGFVFDRFLPWVEAFIAAKFHDLFRVKGIVAIEGRSRRLVVQAVHGWCRAVPGRLWRSDPRISRLVFIGRRLDRREIERGLRGCEARVQVAKRI